MSAEPGLRERKKERTRQQIAEAAHSLFVERGFDAVTVAEVARAADVSQGTVFNYFSTKEELFYGGMEVFEAQLVEAVRERPPGEPVPAAFQRFVLERSSRLAREEVAEVISLGARVIEGSPALQARERQIVAEYTEALADVIAEEQGSRSSRVEAWAVANALMGVQRALVAHVRSLVLAGVQGRKLAAEVRAEGKRAFARLEAGLADYGTKR
jgi:AcrR family transcriptional regulator